tara:strand:+ start:1081 stop:1950 length:870 start_codon:yes stop_codon:yes gene_type:complete
MLEPSIYKEIDHINDAQPIQKGETITLNDIEDNEEQEIKVNISSGNMLDNLKSDMASSEVAEDDGEEDTGITSSEDDFEQNNSEDLGLGNEENEDGFSESDFEDIADFMISGLSLGGSYLLGWYAMDSKAKTYELEKDKMKTLKRQLAKVLQRANVKFSFTTIFIGTLILIYSKNFSDAHNHRKEIMNNPPLPPPVKKANQDNDFIKVVKTDKVEIVDVEIEEEEEEEIEIISSEVSPAEITKKEENSTPFKINSLDLNSEEKKPEPKEVVKIDRPRLRKTKSPEKIAE